MRIVAVVAFTIACSNNAPVPAPTIELEAARVRLTRITCDADDATRRDLLAGKHFSGDSRSRKHSFAIETEVDVPAFEIEQKPVGCEQWRACVDSGACSDESRRRCYDGIVRTSHEQAVKYCRWRGGRLPTYVEWQRAIRGKQALTKVAELDDALTWKCGPHSRPIERFGDNCEVVSQDNVLAYVKWGEEWMESLVCRDAKSLTPYEAKIMSYPKQGLDVYTIEVSDDGAVAWEHGAQFRCVIPAKR